MRKALDYVICAAGEGSRFKSVTGEVPKPLLRLNGKTLLERSVASFNLRAGDRVIFIVQRSHQVRARGTELFERIDPSVEWHWLELDGQTRGQLETAHKARTLLRPGHPVMIFNSDTYFRSKEMETLLEANVDGIIPCSREDGENWSFCETNAQGLVTRVEEKQRISDLASVGAYYFASTELFLQLADADLSAGLGIRKEFYVAPVYNSMIRAGLRVFAPLVETFQPMGSPEQIATYWKIDQREFQRQNE